MATIDYYVFPLSPFSYLAGLRLEEIAARHVATITYKPFDLFRVFAEVGTQKPGERHPNKQRYRMQDIARVARMNNLPVNLRPAHWPTNPVPASAAIIAAQKAAGETGSGDVGRLVHAILRAVWAEDRDIADDAVLADALAEAGFDAALASRGLLSGVQTYERNTEAALAAGVFGSPTYVVGEEVFWGGDRLPHLDAHLAATA
jgi:2-hydroxychromene-2-carboxylate isomerase